jgi:hypothetical protein
MPRKQSSSVVTKVLPASKFDDHAQARLSRRSYRATSKGNNVPTAKYVQLVINDLDWAIVDSSEIDEVLRKEILELLYFLSNHLFSDERKKRGAPKNIEMQRLGILAGKVCERYTRNTGKRLKLDAVVSALVANHKGTEDGKRKLAQNIKHHYRQQKKNKVFALITTGEVDAVLEKIFPKK